MSNVDFVLAMLCIVAMLAATFWWAEARYLRRRRDHIERQRDRAWLAVEHLVALIDQTGDMQLFKDADRIVDAMWSRERSGSQ